MSSDLPPIQPIVNLILVRAGAVLLHRPDSENPAWWLPGADLMAYEHPDEGVTRVLNDFGVGTRATLSHIESFRGRRGWHLVFHYRVTLDADADVRTATPHAWHALDAFPKTAHGD
jgi:ADP-ribose pyrophosphatase YjhB (NUDIX family)